MLRRISPQTISKHFVRFSSTTTPSKELAYVEVDDKTGIATLTMNRPPVNSLSFELLTAISKGLDDVASNKSRGMILTSSSNSVFSAGLDIMEMYKPKESRLREFWSTLQDVWLKLYGSPFPTAAAINGHSPAGGCLLAMSCEYRVMCPGFSIGLNETQLGIIAPTWFQATMNNVLPRRTTEMALTMGRMFTTDEALKIGLIDELATDKNDAIAKSSAFLGKFRKIPPMARALTKQAFRSQAINDLDANRDQDIQMFVFAVTQPKVQQSLEVYLDALKNKNQK